MPQVSVKNKLVESAEDVFRRQGFNGASVQDITSAAGVPKGSFYNHFESKQALAVEIVRRYARGTNFAVLSGDGPALERLRGHFVAMVDRTRDTGVEFGCLLGTFASESSSAGDQVRTAVREILEDWTEDVARTVREGQEAGEITSARPARTLAAFLIDSFEGATLRAKTIGDQSVVAEQLEIALDALRA
ncbi:TetR/AcrR family transcriptional regulator [Microbispora sp. NBRC 16548]|uniref:TetR/AcrR family transcriptional regulator n=1 Tax=Microbispora sp. NBRC 16548 TaxID=3030994 RepID=UPI00161994D5|nr:TetR/AcrR family transcriptional regulator [Microbispora sp. NBRC 16548]GLX09470.1 TetR family transcriptional regulator [Microbispora sp. NBRC 16548]